jgi:hypothetical protein
VLPNAQNLSRKQKAIAGLLIDFIAQLVTDAANDKNVTIDLNAIRLVRAAAQGCQDATLVFKAAI